MTGENNELKLNEMNTGILKGIKMALNLNSDDDAFNYVLDHHSNNIPVIDLGNVQMKTPEPNQIVIPPSRHKEDKSDKKLSKKDLKKKLKYEKFKAKTTTISINYHERQILQALMMYKGISNMQDMMKSVMDSYMHNLTEQDRNTLNFLVNAMDK